MIVSESNNSTFPTRLHDVVFPVYFRNFFAFATVNIGSAAMSWKALSFFLIKSMKYIDTVITWIVIGIVTSMPNRIIKRTIQPRVTKLCKH